MKFIWRERITTMENHEHHRTEEANLEEERIKIRWVVDPLPIKKNQECEIILKVANPDGTPATNFSIVHEKQMHLLAVSKNLADLMHLHPVYEEGGLFRVVATFHQGGAYKLYADFTPEGKSQHLITHEVKVEGEETQEEIKQDIEREKQIDNLIFKLTAQEVAANHHTELVFTIKNAATGTPVSELEPYLGSAGHVVIVSEDQEEFLHVHPVDEKVTGPNVSYMTSFPRRGNYKIWGQFKYKEKIYTVPFVISV